MQGNDYFIHQLYKDASYKYIQSNSDIGMYNDANSLYKQEKFDESIKKYQLISTWENQLFDRFLFHNQGNALYKQGESDAVNRKSLRELSIQSYQSWLAIKDDKDTRFNLEFVKKQLEKLQQQEQQNQQNQQSQSTSSSSPSQQQNTQQGSSWTWSNSTTTFWSSTKASQNTTKNSPWTWSSLSQKNQQSSSSASGAISSNKTWSAVTPSGSEKLNQEQKQALQNYKNQLSKDQVQYGQYYNKVYQQPNTNDPFQNFFGNAFFDNSLLNNGGDNKKDW